MSVEAPENVVRRHLAAFTAGDLTTMLATLAPDATFLTGTTRVEPAEFAEFFGWAIQELQPVISVQSIVTEEDRVACQFSESIQVDGARTELDRAAFYLVEAGLITSVRVYDVRD